MKNKIERLFKSRNFFIMCCLGLLNGIIFYGPVHVIFKQHRGLSMTQIFLLDSILLITTMIFEVPWGIFTDKHGYKNTLLMSSFLLLVSKVIIFKAYSFNMFLINVIISGIAFAGFSGCNEAFIYDSIEEEDSEKSFGLYHAFGTAGFIIASGASGFLADKSLDLTAFFTIIPFAVAFIMCFLLNDIKNENVSEKMSVTSIFKNVANVKQIFIFVLAATLISEIAYTVSATLIQTKYLQVGLDIRYFGVMSILCNVVALAVGFTHRITKRIGQFKAVLILTSLISVSILIINFTGRITLVIFGVLVIQMGSAMIVPIVMDVENRSITKNRTTMLSVYSMFGSIISAGFNIVIGKFADVSLSYSMNFCFGIMVIAMVAIILYFKFAENKYKKNIAA